MKATKQTLQDSDFTKSVLSLKDISGRSGSVDIKYCIDYCLAHNLAFSDSLLLIIADPCVLGADNTQRFTLWVVELVDALTGTLSEDDRKALDTHLHNQLHNLPYNRAVSHPSDTAIRRFLTYPQDTTFIRGVLLDVLVSSYDIDYRILKRLLLEQLRNYYI